MRAIVMLSLSAALFVGCQHPKPSDSATRSSQPVTAKGSEIRPTKPKSPTKSTTPQTAPVSEPVGKVASVNPTLRFVVIDFALNPVPQVDQRMAVYREGQKVGEVKISPQSRNSIIAADVTAGDAKVGDDVRPE